MVSDTSCAVPFSLILPHVSKPRGPRPRDRGVPRGERWLLPDSIWAQGWGPHSPGPVPRVTHTLTHGHGRSRAPGPRLSCRGGGGGQGVLTWEQCP